MAEDQSRHRVVSAGRRFGKSDLGGHELIPEALFTRPLETTLKEAGKRREFWCIGPEYTDAEKEFRVLYNNLSRLGVPFDRPGTYNDPTGGSLHISLWGGTFQVHGKSAKYPDTLVGEGLSGCILAEAAKLKAVVWTKYIRPTLADFNGWSLHTSTPEGKNHFYEKWKMGQDPKNAAWSSWRMPSWINHYVYKTPTLDADVKRMQEVQRTSWGLSTYDIAEKLNLQIDSEILDLANDMTLESFNQEIGAEFSEFVGKVFKDFDEEIHVADLEWNSSSDWQTFAAVDYGYTNPNVWLLIQMGPWGEINVLREYYQPGLTATEFANDIKELGLCPPSLIAFYPDPADPGSSRILENILQKRPMGGTGGELKQRIDAIRAALKATRANPLGYKNHGDVLPVRPQLMFDRSCSNTINDFSTYRYPDLKEESSTPSQEKPMKKNDHAPEALGRWFQGFFGTPVTEVSTTRVRKGRIRR